MMYLRRWRDVNVAHFNGREQYDALERARSLARGALTLSAECMRDIKQCYEHCLFHTHGHTLTIEISVRSDESTREGYLVSDESLSAIVDGLRDKNLSVSSWFEDQEARATTENIVRYLHEQLAATFTFTMPADTIVLVRVWETQDIYAEETRGVLRS